MGHCSDGLYCVPPITIPRQSMFLGSGLSILVGPKLPVSILKHFKTARRPT